MKSMLSPDPYFSSRVLAWFLVCASASFLTRGARVDAAQPAEISDDLVLCVALGLEVQVDGRSGPVQSVSSDALFIDLDGERRKVSMRSGVSYRITREPRVGRTEAVITDTKAKPCFSPRNDPGLAAVRQQGMMGDAEQQSQSRQAQAEASSATAAIPSADLGPTLTPIAKDHAERQTSDRNNLATRGGPPPVLDPAQVDMSGTKDAQGVPYDALALTFTIASREVLEDAFLVLFTDVISPNNPGATVTAVMVRKLPRLGPKPRKVSVQQLGLPFGFALVETRLHVFAHARELLTNLSEKRVEVTKDDAFQFLLWRHLTANKRRDLPATPIPDLMPPDFTEIVPAGLRARKVTLNVDEEGRVRDLKLEDAGATDADAYIESVVRDLRFFPALEDGRPTESSATILLADLVR